DVLVSRLKPEIATARRVTFIGLLRLVRPERAGEEPSHARLYALWVAVCTDPRRMSASPLSRHSNGSWGTFVERDRLLWRRASLPHNGRALLAHLAWRMIVAPLGPRVDRANRSSWRDRGSGGSHTGHRGRKGLCDPQGEVGCRAKTRAYINTVSKQA